MGDFVIESLTCAICLEVAEKAVETSCCHHVFCDDCLTLVAQEPCPQCRKPFTKIISHVSRRMIGNLPAQCKFAGCKDRIVRSGLEDHLKYCPYRTFWCPGNRCQYQGVKKDFALHLASKHEQAIVENAARLFEQLSEPEESACSALEDRIASSINEDGRVCRLGTTGKYYCGGTLNGRRRCACCDGRCGPSNGCNCVSCMKKDVTMRKLPKNWFVNRDGGAARKSLETGRYYCGRCVIGPSRFCDGYCGPTNGPNCQACQILEQQINERYKTVWKD